jgi:anaerobic dimethyl sulfoxide reductase subunit B (iron-sulfur subunit)
VLLDETFCQGDRNCWKACPYGALAYADDAPGTPASKCTMCYDRLERGEQPACVMSCEARALDFGPLEEMEKRYGKLKALEDMPDGELVKPAVVFKPMNPHRKLIPYDEDKALELLQHRPYGLPDLFDQADDVTEVTPGLRGYPELRMKSASVAEFIALSKNEEG